MRKLSTHLVGLRRPQGPVCLGLGGQAEYVRLTSEGYVRIKLEDGNMAQHNPLKSIFTIQKDELPLALLMFSYFFLAITSYAGKCFQTLTETTAEGRSQNET